MGGASRASVETRLHAPAMRSASVRGSTSASKAESASSLKRVWYCAFRAEEGPWIRSTRGSRRGKGWPPLLPLPLPPPPPPPPPLPISGATLRICIACCCSCNRRWSRKSSAPHTPAWPRQLRVRGERFPASIALGGWWVHRLLVLHTGLLPRFVAHLVSPGSPCIRHPLHLRHRLLIGRLGRLPRRALACGARLLRQFLQALLRRHLVVEGAPRIRRRLLLVQFFPLLPHLVLRNQPLVFPVLPRTTVAFRRNGPLFVHLLLAGNDGLPCPLRQKKP